MDADGYSHLPYGLWEGHCSQVFTKCGVPRTNPIPEEFFDAVIDGIVESFYGGMEPEFEDESGLNKFNETCEKIKKLEWLTSDPNDRISV